MCPWTQKNTPTKTPTTPPPTPPPRAFTPSAWTTLITQLRQLAVHVQGLHGNDLAKLLESGFDAASTSNASSPLPTPDILSIAHGHSGQLKPRVTRIRNARNYELRYALVPEGGAAGPWQNGGLHSGSRALTVSGLTPGAVYQFQVRAVGGSTGYSDWSSAVSQRSL